MQHTRRCDRQDLLRFIVIFGPTLSTIDVCTFCLGWFYYGLHSTSDVPAVRTFHTHQFLKGLPTQTLIVHMLRTANTPRYQSRAARVLVLSTLTIMLVGFSIPFVPSLAGALQLVRPKTRFMGFLAAELLVYCLEVQGSKVLCVGLFGKWVRRDMVPSRSVRNCHEKI